MLSFLRDKYSWNNAKWQVYEVCRKESNGFCDIHMYIKNTIILKAAVVFFPCVFKGNIYLLINFVFTCCKFEIFFFSFLFYFFFIFLFFWCKLLNNTERPLPTKALKQVTKRVFFFFNYLPKFATIYFLFHFFKQHIL